MKSKILLGLCAVGAVSVSFVTGCGDDGSNSGGSGGSGGAGPTSTTTTASVTATTSTGMMGDGNDTIGMASPMDEDMGVFTYDGELDPPDSDIDFLSFQGTAGVVAINLDAKPDNDPFAAGYVDVVVTLYDSNQQRIARNDDPFPTFTQDSALLTILPADGTYYISVEEFCKFAADNGDPCDDPDYFTNLTNLDYSVQILHEAVLANAVIPEAAEPNDTLATAATITYNMESAGNYFSSIGHGEFSSMTDVDGFRFTLPSDITIDPGTRLNGNFTFQPPTTDQGTGSSQFAGIVSVVDPVSMLTLASIDMSGELSILDYPDISVPLTGGTEYLLTVEGGAAAVGSLDPFFIFSSFGTQGNPVETQEAMNNLFVSPEALVQQPMTTSFFIEGDLGAGDVDHFLITVTPGDVLTVVCGAQRSGSGVRGLTAEVLNASNGVVIASGGETEDAELLVQDVNPGAETQLVIRMSKAMQDVAVTGTYYRCGYHFNPPTP